MYFSKFGHSDEVNSNIMFVSYFYAVILTSCSRNIIGCKMEEDD